MSSVEEVLAQLSPKLRKSLFAGDSVPEVQFLRSPSPALQKALGGGHALGRQTLIWGNKSAGKSSYCLQMVALAQQDGKVCAWIDSEMSFDKSWAERLGVDTSKLIVSQARSINEMVDIGVQLMAAGVDLIVIDSISALLPAIYFEKDSENLKQLEDTKQIGAESRDFSGAWKMLNYANNKVKPTAIIAISQSRTSIGYISTQIPQGGNATKFYSSTIIKLFSSESESQAIKGDLVVGDKVLQKVIGRKVNWEVQFNKTGPAFQSGSYNFYFRGDNIGVDTVFDLVEIAEAEGIVVRGGAWYSFGEEQHQGKDKLVKAIRENPELVKQLMEKVNETV